MTIAYDESVRIDGQTAARAVADLYEELIGGWNGRDAGRLAAPFAEDGEVIGFDGSEQAGQVAIARAMRQIFEDHETGAYVSDVRSSSIG
jgi:uncharacterized protein (TIGR02246 family)